MNVVVANLIHMDMVQYASSATTHATTITFQEKAQLHVELILGDDFILLAMKSYSCFHSCFDSFLTPCA
jgi:hypothetical protein